MKIMVLADGDKFTFECYYNAIDQDFEIVKIVVCFSKNEVNITNVFTKQQLEIFLDQIYKYETNNFLYY